jgi:Rieske Fe-S protein
MSQESQERFEDYLELEQFIEQLHSQRSARLPANLAPQQTRIYGMAVYFNTAAPRVADPRPEFKAQLYQRLLKQARAEEQLPEKRTGGVVGVPVPAPTTPVPAPTIPPQGQKQLRNIYRNNNQVSQPAQVVPTNLQSMDVKRQKTRAVSRRTLGTIAASVLASAGVGAAVGAGIEQSSQPKPDQHPTLTENVPGTWLWHPVTSVKHLGTEAVSFTANAITGYVIRQKGNTSGEQQIIALSAACPHLGCPVQWQGDQREFQCPCHSRAFDTAGGPVVTKNGQPHYISLSRLETKIENGNIYVKVPPPTSA